MKNLLSSFLLEFLMQAHFSVLLNSSLINLASWIEYFPPHLIIRQLMARFIIIIRSLLK
jgi:hypothetical protein